MTRHSSFAVFSIVATIVYALAYNFGWQLFRYYPLVYEFRLGPQPKEAGPAMMYYGWIATAAIAGLVAALVVPKSWAARLWSGWSWLVPLATVLFTLYYEKHWFIR